MSTESSRGIFDENALVIGGLVLLGGGIAFVSCYHKKSGWFFEEFSLVWKYGFSFTVLYK